MSEASAAAQLEWWMPEPREVTVLGHRMAYYEAGEGPPPLVLLHGFSGSAYFEWGRVFERLAERHRVVAFQQIGFLPSEQPAIVYTTDAQLAHMSGLIAALGLEGAVLVGESYGGWAVGAYAARAAEPGGGLAEVAAYAIVCGAVNVTRRVSPTARGFSSDAIAAEVEARLGELNPHNAANDATRQAIVEASELTRNWPETQALGRIAKPVLLLWGAEDELIPLRYGEAAAAAIPRAELVVLPGVGHIPSVEAPDDFIRILTDFAGRVQG
jgi:pimeloyl-ACP methyl ester carboxylesterase